MRLSEIGEKEIVNLTDGERFGQLSEAELLVDERYGKIKSMLVQDFRTKKSFFGFGGFGARNQIEVPWSFVKKIGQDIIVFETVDKL